MEKNSAQRLFLLADDDHDDAWLFLEALQEVSVTVVHVEDGQQVLTYLSNTHNKTPDVIFLDLNMPELNGWQCLAKLKNDIYFENIPVVIYTTSSHPREREIALQLGASGFFTKPTDFKVLKSILTELAREDTRNYKDILDRRR